MWNLVLVILVVHKDVSHFWKYLLKGQAPSTGELKQGIIIPWLHRLSSVACKTGGPERFLARIYGLKGHEACMERTLHREPRVLGSGDDDDDDMCAVKRQLNLCGSLSRSQREPQVRSRRIARLDVTTSLAWISCSLLKILLPGVSRAILLPQWTHVIDCAGAGGLQVSENPREK